MEDSKLINLWNSYDEKFNDSYLLIQKNLQDISQMKTKSFLSSMKPVKLFTVLAGIIWVGIVGTVVSNLFVFAYSKVSLFFLYSAAVQVLLTAIAIIAYLYQLILIYQVDITEPVVKTQETLVRLKTSTLWVTRILFLQLPVWTTFYLSQHMFIESNIPFLIVQVIITTSFTYFALWLFFNIRYENRDKKWFKLIFNGREWTPLLKSMELLEQINDYKSPV
jgi:hypothetical protein